MSDGANIEDGYTRIANDLLEAILAAPFTKVQLKILFSVARKTYGWGKKLDYISSYQIEGLTNLDSSNIRKGLGELKKDKVIIFEGKNIGINKNYHEWQVGSKQPGKGLKQPCHKAGLKQPDIPGQNNPTQGQNNPKIRVKTTLTKEKKETITKEKKEIEKENSSESADQVRQIFKHWQTLLNHPRAVLDPKRRKKIKTALDSYGFESCLAAIRGVTKTPWNMGNNPNNTVYDDIELIFRDAKNTERFIRADTQPPEVSTMSAVTRQNIANMEVWLSGSAKNE